MVTVNFVLRLPRTLSSAVCILLLHSIMLRDCRSARSVAVGSSLSIMSHSAIVAPFTQVSFTRGGIEISLDEFVRGMYYLQRASDISVANWKKILQVSHPGEDHQRTETVTTRVAVRDPRSRIGNPRDKIYAL